MKDGRLTFAPGRDVVQLPNINYMRELGAIFLNSYTNSPICCPSRAGETIVVIIFNAFVYSNVCLSVRILDLLFV